MAIAVGTPAPDFTLDGTKGKVTLSAYKGKKDVVLFFFPLAFTPVWSRELPACEADYTQFAEKNAELFAVSVDSVPTNKAFAESLKVTKYAFLSDFHPKGGVSRKYGLYLEDKGITARATVVVGKDGKVKWCKVNDLGTQRQNGEILKACG